MLQPNHRQCKCGKVNKWSTAEPKIPAVWTCPDCRKRKPREIEKISEEKTGDETDFKSSGIEGTKSEDQPADTMPRRFKRHV